jgi:hypothetical protein
VAACALELLDAEQVLAGADGAPGLPVLVRERLELVVGGLAPELVDPVVDDPRDRAAVDGADRLAELRAHQHLRDRLADIVTE